MTTAKSANYHPVSLNREYLTGKMQEILKERHAKAWNDFSLAQRGQIRDEFHATIQSLEESLATGNPAFLIDHAIREQSHFTSHNYPPEFVISFFKAFKAVAGKDLPEDYRKNAEAFAKIAVSSLKSPNAGIPDARPALSSKAKSFLKYALAGDQAQACKIIDKALADGMPVREVYTGIFGPALQETGGLWQQNEVTIAQEHYVTAVIWQIMEQIHNQITAEGRKARREKTVVAACVGEELHEVGIRMVSDFFELDGWNVYYTGANTPAKSILAAVRDQKADVVALSITMPSHLADLRYLIRSLRAEQETAKVKVIVGGYPFAIMPDLWKQVGADTAAVSAEDAVAAANRLTGGSWKKA